jgi:hypothetical protein
MNPVSASTIFPKTASLIVFSFSLSLFMRTLIMVGNSLALFVTFLLLVVVSWKAAPFLTSRRLKSLPELSMDEMPFVFMLSLIFGSVMYSHLYFMGWVGFVLSLLSVVFLVFLYATSVAYFRK